MLAAKGFTGHAEIFEHPAGDVAVCFGEGFDFEAVTQDFGGPYRMVDPNIAIKKHPSQYSTHRGIDAALELRQMYNIDPAQIASVHIETTVMRYTDRGVPQTGLEGKFSLQCTVASALLDGHINMGTFEVLKATLSLHDDAGRHGRRCRITLRAAGIVQMLVVDMQRHYDLIGLVRDAADTIRASCARQGLTVVRSVRDRPFVLIRGNRLHVAQIREFQGAWAVSGPAPRSTRTTSNICKRRRANCREAGDSPCPVSRGSLRQIGQGVK